MPKRLRGPDSDALSADEVQSFLQTFFAVSPRARENPEGRLTRLELELGRSWRPAWAPSRSNVTIDYGRGSTPECFAPDATRDVRARCCFTTEL